MALSRVHIALLLCLCGLAAVTLAQTGKAPLWTITTVGGTTAPHSSDVCIAQTLIDESRALLPTFNGDCHVTRLATVNSVSAGMVCTGATVGQAIMRSPRTVNHASGSIHFVGTFPRSVARTGKCDPGLQEHGLRLRPAFSFAGKMNRPKGAVPSSR
jgi:hypothetical protein